MSDGGSIRDLLDHDVAPGNVGQPAPAYDARPARPPAAPLRLSVAWGDLTRTAADVHVVGHYEDVLPAAAEGALDAAISTGPRGIITEHTRRGWLVGRLGEVTYFPSGHDTVRIPAVAGLGRHGTFTEHRAVQFYTSLVTELTALGLARRAAMVLIGSGAGNLSVAQACRALVDGFTAGLARVQGAPALTEVVVVEIDRLRAEEVLDALVETADQAEGSGLQVSGPVTVVPGGVVSTPAAAVFGALALARLAAGGAEQDGAAPGSGARSAPAVIDAVDGAIRDLVRERLSGLAGVGAGEVARMIRSVGQPVGGPSPDGGRQEKPVRISVLSADDSIRWAALSDFASIAERHLARTQVFTDLVARLNNPSPEDALRLPEWLSRMIVPTDFHALVTDRAPLVLELDRSTAPLHWELLADLDARRDETGPPLVVRTPISRRLRTGYARVRIDPVLPTELRALVVGDPGRPGRASLAGAREEAKQVRTALRDLGVQVTAYIGAPEDAREDDLDGVPPATRLEVLGELLSGGYEIVHFCGHGTFDEQDPERRAGWVFADGLLTSRELAQLAEPPRIIVANACYTSVLGGAGGEGGSGASERALEASLTPGLADEFLRAGVVHYVGTAWQIHDVAGLAFARTLYTHLLGKGTSVGTALCASRSELWDHRDEWGVSWAAYQHYGDPTDFLQVGAHPDEDWSRP